MVNGCVECERLWREYADVTNEHFKLDNKLQLAGLSHNHEVIQKLTPEVKASGQRRIALREEITIHERDAHSPATHN